MKTKLLDKKFIVYGGTSRSKLLLCGEENMPEKLIDFCLAGLVHEWEIGKFYEVKAGGGEYTIFFLRSEAGKIPETVAKCFQE